MPVISTPIRRSAGRQAAALATRRSTLGCQRCSGLDGVDKATGPAARRLTVMSASPRAI
jgi:hypothetical protein